MPDDGQVEPHRACAFGQWLYHQAQHDLRGRPEYASIEAAHRRLHRLAAQLRLEMAGRESVSIGAFDQFVAESGRLRRELDSLRHEMSVALRSRDALTGTYRRIELLPALREARELALRSVQPSCIAFMDLDHFKVVNDSYGHGIGDEVLAGAARCVTEHLRPYDKVFRYGGDEFLMLLPGTDPEGAWHLVDRIRDALAGSDARHDAGRRADPAHRVVRHHAARRRPQRRGLHRPRGQGVAARQGRGTQPGGLLGRGRPARERPVPGTVGAAPPSARRSSRGSAAR